jgi:hypothetical protein
MTKAEYQARWRRKRAAQAAEAAQAAALAQVAAEVRPKPAVDIVIRPEPQGGLEPIVRPDHGEYAGVIRTVLDFCDALPQPQVHLLELIQKLQTEYRRRQSK